MQFKEIVYHKDYFVLFFRNWLVYAEQGALFSNKEIKKLLGYIEKTDLKLTYGKMVFPPG